MKKVVYRVKEIQLHSNSPFWGERLMCEFLDFWGLTANILYNTALSVELSHCTAIQKKATGEPLTHQEQEIEDNIAKHDIHSSPSGFISYPQMDRYMRMTKNSDYCDLPEQARSYTLKQLTEDYQGCLYAWESPSSLYEYGKSKVIFSSQEARIWFNKLTKLYWLELPKSSCPLINPCKGPIEGTLEQVETLAFGSDTITLRLILADIVEDDVEDWEDSED